MKQKALSFVEIGDEQSQLAFEQDLKLIKHKIGLEITLR